MNEKLLASAARLDDAQLRRPYPIGQGSVPNTLLHLYAAEHVWHGTARRDADLPGPAGK